MRGLRRMLVALAATCVVGGLVAAIVGFGESLPEGPEPVAWDREACAECRMHVGDPRFAVQLQDADGRVSHFDDPGCWFLYERRAAPAVHAVYFHAHDGKGWLRAADTCFARVDSSPMGFGLGAVPAVGGPCELTLEQARSHALEVPATPHAPGAGGHGP